MVAPGLFYVDCGSGPLGDGGVIADGLNWDLPGVLWGESSRWSNLNGCGVDRFTHGCPGPLTFIQYSFTAQVISHQPS